MTIYAQMHKYTEQNAYTDSGAAGDQIILQCIKIKMFQLQNLSQIEESCNLIEKSCTPSDCSRIKVSPHFYTSDIFVCMFCSLVFLFVCFFLLYFVF